MKARVGFIVDNQVPALRFDALRQLGPLSLLRGANSTTGMGVMRFGWVAEKVNCRPEWGLEYELYRPGRRYDLLVFLKSFGPQSLRLAQRQRARDGAAVFEVNVNYFDAQGTFYYDGMQPTATQIENATRMGNTCDGVIAASSALRDICRPLNPRVEWIPDNVNMELVPEHTPWRPAGDVLPLLWCGQSLKLFELLAIEDALRAFRKRIKLVLVTNSQSVLTTWYEPYRERFSRLLIDVPHEIVPYESIPQLLELYSRGGVMISPRFMDNSYNLGHTEWKLTLGMACGRVALGSPIQSYLDLAQRSGDRGIRICDTPADWERAFDLLLGGTLDWPAEEYAARHVVTEYYSTSVVAAAHAKYIRNILESKVS